MITSSSRGAAVCGSYCVVACELATRRLTEKDAEEPFHVLLIGIDGYAWPNTLAGYVNDIDRVEQALLEPGAKLDESCIRRLVSPTRKARIRPRTAQHPTP